MILRLRRGPKVEAPTLEVIYDACIGVQCIEVDTFRLLKVCFEHECPVPGLDYVLNY